MSNFSSRSKIISTALSESIPRSFNRSVKRTSCIPAGIRFAMIAMTSASTFFIDLSQYRSIELGLACPSFIIAQAASRLNPTCGVKSDKGSVASRPPHHVGHQRLDVGRANLLHDGAQFDAQKLEHALDAGLTEGAETPRIGPAHAHRGGAHAKRLGDVGAAAETA